MISGNRGNGIILEGDGDWIQGNYIGIDATGSTVLGNNFGIIGISGGSNVIGGTEPGARNVISGNTSDGIDIASRNNRVQGNYIGTDVSGTAALGNNSGIYMSSAGLTTVGGTATGILRG